MSEWKAISEAPKDGELLLLAGPGYGGTQWVAAGWYDDEHEGWWEMNTCYSDATDGQCYPTHFMPLPAPPKETKE